MSAIKFIVQSSGYGQCPYVRFGLVNIGSGKRTVVKVTKQGHQYLIVVADVKWSKYKFINKLKKLFIKIKYW